jgi:gamma-glutamyl:cysteine ligase YbdK (ATP-grasp superfamily)
MTRTGVVKSMKDFYWDIRPKPEFGTIEVRVCDTPLTVEKAAALACYLHAWPLPARAEALQPAKTTTSSTPSTASRPAASGCDAWLST